MEKTSMSCTSIAVTSSCKKGDKQSREDVRDEINVRVIETDVEKDVVENVIICSSLFGSSNHKVKKEDAVFGPSSKSPFWVNVPDR